jgi:hypothetical protein
VEYLWIKQNKNPPLGSWPFLKRKQFEDENEFRIIYESAAVRTEWKQVRIRLSCINRITLSPWLPKAVEGSVIDVIKKIDGCAELRVKRSSLLDNTDWRGAID